MNNVVSIISILDVTVDTSYIRTLQVVTIKIDMNTANVFGTGRDLYLEIP